MMSLSTPVGNVIGNPAIPSTIPSHTAARNAPSAADRGFNAQAAIAAAAARADAIRTQASASVSDAAKAAVQANNAAQASVPNVMDSLSTVAVVGAMNSLPAALTMMQDIAMASASGALSDADRAQLAAEYAQLSQKVGSVVGSAAASQQTPSSADKQDEHDAANPDRQSADDRRTTLTQVSRAAPQTVALTPVEKLVTTTSSTLVPQGNDVTPTPSVVLHTHEVHVGTDSYEPAAVRQTQTRLDRPATIGQIEHHTTTHRVTVAQVAQIAQFTQVAQVQQLSAIA